MSHIAVIVGIAGSERYLARGREVTEKKEARRFRSRGAAEAAAKAHIEAFPTVITRQMSFRVESPEAHLKELDGGDLERVRGGA